MAKEYANADITIKWQAKLCQHAAICVGTLPKVYKPKTKPWIHPENASTEALISQINQCPSGALTYSKNEDK